MQSLVSWFSSFLLKDINVNPLYLLNHLLQAFFFSSAVCNGVCCLLKMINFVYAQEVASSKIVQVFGWLLLYYLKVWEYYNGLLYILSIFSMFLVGLYVYDCCGNISSHFDNWKEQHRDLAVIGSFSVMFLSTAYIVWQIFKNEEKPLIYPYSGLYLLMLLAILIGNLLRRRSIIYSLLAALTINYLIAARHYISCYYDSILIKNAELPIETIVYFVMAFDAEKRQRDAMKADSYKSVFKACASMAAYSLLNDGSFPIQLLVAGAFIIGIATGK